MDEGILKCFLRGEYLKSGVFWKVQPGGTEVGWSHLLALCSSKSPPKGMRSPNEAPGYTVLPNLSTVTVDASFLHDVVVQ